MHEKVNIYLYMVHICTIHEHFSKITSPTKRECKFNPEKIDIKKNVLKHLFLIVHFSPTKTRHYCIQSVYQYMLFIISNI